MLSKITRSPSSSISSGMCGSMMGTACSTFIQYTVEPAHLARQHPMARHYVILWTGPQRSLVVKSRRVEQLVPGVAHDQPNPAVILIRVLRAGSGRGLCGHVFRQRARKDNTRAARGVHGDVAPVAADVLACGGIDQARQALRGEQGVVIEPNHPVERQRADRVADGQMGLGRQVIVAVERVNLDHIRLKLGVAATHVEEVGHVRRKPCYPRLPHRVAPVPVLMAGTDKDRYTHASRFFLRSSFSSRARLLASCSATKAKSSGLGTKFNCGNSGVIMSWYRKAPLLSAALTSRVSSAKPKLSSLYIQKASGSRRCSRTNWRPRSVMRHKPERGLSSSRSASPCSISPQNNINE